MVAELSTLDRGTLVWLTQGEFAGCRARVGWYWKKHNCTFVVIEMTNDLRARLLPSQRVVIIATPEEASHGTCL